MNLSTDNDHRNGGNLNGGIWAFQADRRTAGPTAGRSRTAILAEGIPGVSPGAKGKGKGKKKGKLARDQSKLSQSAGADAEPGIRDRMVDIGRGNQQAGRQRTSGK